MAKYLSIYPPDVDCNTDDKIFIRFKVFALPASITDNFYHVRVIVTNENWFLGDDARWYSLGNLPAGDYTSRGKAVLWDRKISDTDTGPNGIRQPQGDYLARIELYDNVGTRLETTSDIKFTID